MSVTKILKVGGGLLLTAYIMYVVAVAAFLNTPLFRKAAKMDNDDQTYVSFTGAVSWWPGYLHASAARVFISDQNVSIGIDLKDVGARFNLQPLLHKWLEVTKIDVADTEVEIGMKTPKESEEFQKKYVKPGDLDRSKRAALAEENREAHLTINFPDITLHRLHNIRGGFGQFTGEMALQGGFVIQPKVQVEVYPSTLKCLSGMVGEVTTHFDKFQILDAPGNAVFPYVTANLDLKVQTDSFKTMDLSLEKLPGYSLDGVGSNGVVRIAIVKGVIQKGSYVESLPGRLAINTPGLATVGNGKFKWNVDTEESSTLTANLQNIKIRDKSQTNNHGTLKKADLHIRLFGNNLVNAFHGVATEVKLDGLAWTIKSQKEKNDNFEYQGLITGGGVLTGFAGNLPPKVKAKPGVNPNLNLNIQDLRIKTSFIKEMKGKGTLMVSSAPVDLLSQSIQFPRADATLDLQLDKHGEVKTKASFTQIEHRLAPEDTWKGKLVWVMENTEPLVKAIAAQGELSKIVQSMAKVRNLTLDVACELGKESTWLRFNKITSSGSWKGYGTLKNEEAGMSGLFEVAVLGAPVGIRIQPDKTDIKFLPGKDWYNENLQK